MKKEVKPKFYRNKRALVSIEEIDVDADSLWEWNAEKKLMILVDFDQYVTHLKDKRFYIADK